MNTQLILDIITNALKEEDYQIEVDTSELDDGILNMRIDYNYFGTASLTITAISSSYLFKVKYTSKTYSRVTSDMLLEVREDRMPRIKEQVKRFLLEARIGGDLS